jgi:uncharacterized membrane protein
LLLKIKFINGILIVDILTILLVLAIYYSPSNVARIVLGLPFLLFFPGYVLLSALFVHKNSAENFEKIVLSCGTSIAIVGLIGFGLNYTDWGVRLQPVLFSLSAFIIAVSAVALIRRALVLDRPKLTMELTIHFPGLAGNAFSKSVSIFLMVAVLGSIGFLGYNVTSAKTVDKFTEFYVLGHSGTAEAYPADFLMDQGKVVGVSYNSGKTYLADTQGVITLGIINHEAAKTTYSIVATLNGKQIAVTLAGKSLDRIGPIELQPDEKWEQEIRFAPQQTDDNQKVEFLLYKDNANSPYDSLHLWINVKQAN